MRFVYATRVPERGNKRCADVLVTATFAVVRREKKSAEYVLKIIYRTRACVKRILFMAIELCAKLTVLRAKRSTRRRRNVGRPPPDFGTPCRAVRGGIDRTTSKLVYAHRAVPRAAPVPRPVNRFLNPLGCCLINQ